MRGTCTLTPMASTQRTLALGALLVLGTACAPEAVDAQGREIEGLYDFFSAVAAVVFTITAGLIAWSILRYRRRPEDDSLPNQLHTNVPLELIWFAIPQVIVVVLFLVSIQSLGEVDEEDPAPAITVRVQGFQWGWRFTYEELDVVVQGSAGEDPQIILPVDQSIAFVLTSQDVIHSFYIPQFLMKRDTIPGRENRFDVKIEEEGTYAGKCAEFCGLLHGRMNFSIRSVDASAFDEWVSEQQGAG
jgi:cytochrome c oxidase subunit II